MVLQARMDLSVGLNQHLVMTPMLQQAIAMLPMTRMELQQKVQQELMENPTLEENLDEIKEIVDGEMPELRDDLPSTETDERGEVEIDWENIVHDTYGLDNFAPPAGNDDLPSIQETMSVPESLPDHLEFQLKLSFVSEIVQRVAQEIIWNIDDSGYLRSDPAEFITFNGYSPSHLAEALALVQSFDPPGVGARDLKECLLLQLNLLDFQAEEHQPLLRLAKMLVEEQIENLFERNYQRLARAFKVDLGQIQLAIVLIRSLSSQPGEKFTQELVEIAEPDVTVTKRGDDYEVILNDDGLPPLRISQTYRAMAANRDNVSPETKKFIEGKVQAALWFIKSIERRRTTILKVSQSIVKFQRGFLDRGISGLRPLVLRDVADDIEMHESTVSRVTTGKYMETPQGVFHFKYFFHSALGSKDRGGASSVAVRETIRQMVEKENKQKPLTDIQLMERLKEAEIKIARRTVTKYRKELHIPSASHRRQIH